MAHSNNQFQFLILFILYLLVAFVAGQRIQCLNESIPSLEPVTQKFVDAAAAGTPIYELSIPAARASLEDAQAPGSPSLSTVDYQELDIPVGPTGSVNIHVFRPLGTSNKTLPVTVYFHGPWLNRFLLVLSFTDKGQQAAVGSWAPPTPIDVSFST
jgi:hypothetical protein